VSSPPPGAARHGVMKPLCSWTEPRALACAPVSFFIFSTVPVPPLQPPAQSDEGSPLYSAIFLIPAHLFQIITNHRARHSGDLTLTGGQKSLRRSSWTLSVPQSVYRAARFLIHYYSEPAWKRRRNSCIRLYVNGSPGRRKPPESLCDT